MSGETSYDNNERSISRQRGKRANHSTRGESRHGIYKILKEECKIFKEIIVRTKVINTMGLQSNGFRDTEDFLPFFETVIITL